MIDIQGFGYRFAGSTQDALADITLRIAPGEFVVVTGPSGCGKSTLALAMGGYLFSQYEGRVTGVIRVAGMDAQRTPVYDLAEIVGLVQQNPEAQFCTLTVLDEVAFGLENRCLPRAEIRQRIEWALGVVGAGQLIDRDLATLSGGEKQKIAIAAVMAARPKVLIFDEPTSNLDPSATAEIFDVIREIRAEAGITVIVIEHKVSYLASFRPRLIEMAAGRIVKDGQLDSPRPFWTGHARTAGRLLPEQPPIIRVDDLWAGHDGNDVLRGITLTIKPGEFVAVMGDNGSGKTTFLRCLLGLTKPRQGRVDVLGHDTRHTPVSELARRVGMVFQNPEHQLFASSVWNEVVFAPHNLGILDDDIRERANHLLRQCGLEGRSQDHPYRLSYGQKRRLNLISVLIYRPTLILLDEMLIGQDAENAAFLMGLLGEHVAAGGTVILVNHSPEVTRHYASRLLFFDDGQLVVDAPVQEAFRQLDALGKRAYLTAETQSAQRFST